MAVSINHLEAKKLLEDTLPTASFKDDEIGKDIELILKGTHKTYRYVSMIRTYCEHRNKLINNTL